MEVWRKHPGSGLLVSNRGRVIVWGKPTPGSKIGNGYRQVIRQGVPYYVHRLVLDTFKPNQHKWLYDRVDHIDRNKDNNKVENLRWSTATLNRLNSNAKNVSLRKSGRWRARIGLYGKELYLGSFKTKEEALAEVKRMKKEVRDLIEY